jgi:cell division protein FtsL
VFVVSSGLLLLVAFGLVYLHVVMAQRQIRLNELNAEVAQAQSTYQNLELNVANLDAPQEIISTAEGKLGMRQPTSVTFLSPPADAPHASAATSGSDLPGQGSGTKAQAPAGDANWPHIKAELAGSP